MKRYDCYYTNDFNSEYPALSRAAVDGDWVSFEDAQAEVANADEALRQAVAVISSRNEQIAKLRDELTAANLERDALKRELVVRKRCSYGGDYGVCELEAGHDGRHSLRSPSKTSVEGQS